MLDPALEVITEIDDPRRYGVSRRVAERAETLAENLVGHVIKQFDVARAPFVTMHPVEDFIEPARAFATRRTPPARLVFVKMGDVARRLEDVSRLVHDDHAAGAEHRPGGGDRFVIERDLLALFGGQDRN